MCSLVCSRNSPAGVCAQGVYEESASVGLERRPDELPESGEAPWRNVGEPEAEEDHVVTVFGAPVEKVSLGVADGRLGVGFPESGAVDVEHLWRVVDGGYGVCMTGELDRPQAGTSRELEHVAGGAERVELPSDLLKLGEHTCGSTRGRGRGVPCVETIRRTRRRVSGNRRAGLRVARRPLRSKPYAAFACVSVSSDWTIRRCS